MSVMTTRSVLAVIVLFSATDLAGAQSFIPPPALPGYARPSSGYFTPPGARSEHRTATKPARVRIPEPEKAIISEEYAKGSIVIVNHERRLYFVEEVGRATRYPVAIGKRDDQWDGVETVTAKRENPTWYPPEEVQLEMDVPAVVPRAAKIHSDLGRYISAIHCTEFMEQIGLAPLAARYLMAVFACTTCISSSFSTKWKSGPTSTSCPEGTGVAHELCSLPQRKPYDDVRGHPWRAEG